MGLLRVTYRLGRLAGLQLTAEPSALLGSLLLWALLAAAGVRLLGLPAGAAMLGALIATLLHWFSELVHQFGHAWAARRVGYPMTGVRFWAVLGSSLYPPDEPALPARIHIWRALGGPIASFGLTLVAALIATAPWAPGSVSRWVTLVFLLENVFVFTLQVFVPLGFNDGGTLWSWWPRRHDP